MEIEIEDTVTSDEENDDEEDNEEPRIKNVLLNLICCIVLPPLKISCFGHLEDNYSEINA